ncbi:hypothetical protein KM043_012710 [Ampulex compressa]|nr:hypothetical protein KM043_012710 [Ampulex compressa]
MADRRALANASFEKSRVERRPRGGLISREASLGNPRIQNRSRPFVERLTGKYPEVAPGIWLSDRVKNEESRISRRKGSLFPWGTGPAGQIIREILEVNLIGL